MSRVRPIAGGYAGESLADSLLAYAGRADACATMTELTALASGTVALVGMSVIASGMITGPRVARGETFHLNTWPAAWMALYAAQGFLDVDPLPRWAIVSGAPARWSEILRDLPPSDPGHEVAAAARGFGWVEGVITPVRTRAGHLGLVSVGGARPNVTAEALFFIEVVCMATLHRADALCEAEAPPPAPRLSRREHECVALLTQGVSEREMSALLGISEVTARFHLDNARAKTGARSRIHLAALAAQWLGRPRASK